MTPPPFSPPVALNSRPPPWLRRIACLSTSRADAGIYRPLLEALAAEQVWEVHCLAGGTHPAEDFGRTISEFANLAGIRLVSVHHWTPGDDPIAVAATAGRATGAFSGALAEHAIDLAFVLGDRTEMLAAAMAALIHRIPIAHLHGGDATEGAYDDQCRHAITKISHLHFAALEEHGRRIVAMGEEPWRVQVVGALALDALRGFQPEPVDDLSASLGLDLRQPTIVVAYYPETLCPLPSGGQIEVLLGALRPLDANLLLIGPNADVGHRAIREALTSLAANRRNTVLVSSLSQQRFWSCLAHAALLIGNSSAGLLEAASFKLPVVNVGRRQQGRLHPANVLNAPLDEAAIGRAVAKATAPSFRWSLADLVNPYGDGRAAERIVLALRALFDRDALLRKRRYPPAERRCDTT